MKRSSLLHSTSHAQLVAIDRLMRAAVRVARAVVEDLAETAYPPDYVYGSREWIPSPSLRAWAERWGVGTQNFYRWFSHTYDQWEVDSESRAALTWYPPRPSFSYSSWSEYMQENPKDPLAPVGAAPDVETKAEFNARAAAHWDARADDLKKRWKLTSGGTERDEQFDWLARYQFNNESLKSITDSVQPTYKTVRAGVSAAATRAGILLRRHSRGGKRRPRGAKI